MRARKTFVCICTFIVIDAITTTVLYVYGSKQKNMMEDLTNFNIFTSLLDIWGLCLLRSCLLLGALIGVAKNFGYGPRRLEASLTCIMLLCLLFAMYVVTKVLLFSEVEKPIKDPWFWSLFAWTNVAAAATVSCWWLLSLITPSRHGSNLYFALRAEETERPGNTSMKKETESPRATISRLLSFSRPDVFYLGLAFFFLLANTLGETFTPYFTGLVIDGIVVQRSLDQFSSAVLILSLLAVGSAFAAGVRGGLFTFTFARLNVRIRNLLFRSLVSQEIGFFDENHTGDIISRLTSDTTVMSDVISENVNVFLRGLVKMVGVVIFMFSLCWQLSLVTFMGFPIILLISQAYGKYYKKLAKEVQNALAKANSTAEETLSAMKTVRSFANEETEANIYWEKLQQVYILYKKEALAYTYYMWATGFTQLVLQISILYYGGHLVISKQMTSGNLISFIIYEFLLGDSMESMGSVYSGLMQGVGAAEKVFGFIDRRPEMVNNGTLAPDDMEGKVEFKHVTFSYPMRPAAHVLKDVTFTLHPGKVTALVGPSGSGKSSCVNILEHFYPLQEGEVLLDGYPIHLYQHKYLHTKVSLVSQEPVLFARSIEDNISYGLNSVPLESIVQAATRANADGFIKELQNGYKTDTGEKGTQLSGGQKQRVAIARALVRKPQVLILDEATSALDAESEHAIQQAINTDLKFQTVLIIAHRLSTVEKAHDIIVLDKGRVVQQGTHRKLMEEGGLYCKLVQRQVLGDSGGLFSDRHVKRRSRDSSVVRQDLFMAVNQSDKEVQM
uniref:ABC-type oligopeptide transporter ABCB9 n=1 Tax=Geotrypetes seraphini TaxID=260995 RepID=A0A6P8RXD8_GEOSA|nr:ATP-binding cassette sub-family B member 9 [Geotrypetes seraphini]XP_033810189.1 ATP-binding cassette sub-family B member 9 [Geotrypetes seraphini]